LNGDLAGQPQAYAFDAIDRSTLGLEPLPVASVAGLIAVGLSEDVDPAAAFADIEPELRWCGYETHEIVCQHTFHLKANWKIAFDVNLETYHVDYLHRETLSNTWWICPRINGRPSHRPASSTRCSRAWCCWKPR
jgi:phenylpropionate dioxygenase-like ring-hydroxylating dioxygenase large terminal subunit